MHSPTSPNGNIAWIDLTVEDARSAREFYSRVAGWDSAAVSMGDYDDYLVGPPMGEPIAGICHRRGVNADVPAQWLLYIQVQSLDVSLNFVRNLGGKVVCEPREVGQHGRMAVVEDPFGAVLGLIEIVKQIY